MKLKRTPREVAPSEVHDLLGEVYSSISPWVTQIEYLGKERWSVSHEDEGADLVTTTITANQILRAIEKAAKNGELCCGATMEDEELGLGCSADADNALQYAVFGKLVFG